MSDENIQEMQLIEQSLQNILLQKQAFQMELSEVDAALKELGTTGEEVFKIVGNLMIKTEKKKTQEDLENKKKLLELRLKTFDNQEESLSQKLEKLRDQILKSAKKK